MEKIIVCVGELVESSVRELLEGEDVNYIRPGNERWMKRKDISLAIIQDGLGMDVKKVASKHRVIVLSGVDTVTYKRKMMRWRVRDVVPLSATGKELLESVEGSRSGFPLHAKTEPNETVRLSKRERQVLVGIGKRKTNAQIGEDLSVGSDYVKQISMRLYAKLGIQNLGSPHCRIAAMDYAKENGFV